LGPPEPAAPVRGRGGAARRRGRLRLLRGPARGPDRQRDPLGAADPGRRLSVPERAPDGHPSYWARRMTTTNRSAKGVPMSTPVEHLDIESPTTTIFDFDYTGARDQLLRLYDKGTRRQWIGSEQVDLAFVIGPHEPSTLAAEGHPLFS